MFAFKRKHDDELEAGMSTKDIIKKKIREKVMSKLLGRRELGGSTDKVSITTKKNDSNTTKNLTPGKKAVPMLVVEIPEKPIGKSQPHKGSKHSRHRSIPNPFFERFCMIFGTRLAQLRPDLTQAQLLEAMKAMYVNQPEWMRNV